MFSPESLPFVRAVIAALPTGVFVTDAEGCISLVNPACARILATPEAAMLGRTSQEVWPGRPAEGYLCNRAIATRSKVGPEHFAGVNNGRAVEAVIEAQPIFGPDGQVRGVVCSVMDLNLAAEHLIWDSFPLPLLFWSDRARVSYLNQAAADLLGVQPEEVHGMDLAAFAAAFLAQGQSADRWERLSRGELVPPRRFDLVPRGGGRVSVEVVSRPVVRSGVFCGVMTFVRDLRPQLAQERQERLDAMGKLLAGAAHEIRNPLAALLGVVQLLKRHPERADRYQAAMEKELRRAVALLEDLMFLGRPTRLELREQGLGDLVRETLAGLAGTAAAHNVRIALEVAPGPDRAQVDPARVAQVLYNLCQNALDAMPEGGGIRVAVIPAADQVRVEVADTGQGMSPAELEHSLDPFFSTKQGGTGLGLAICRRIMEDHGGAIELYSRPGAGTTAVLRFPRPGVSGPG